MVYIIATLGTIMLMYIAQNIDKSKRITKRGGYYLSKCFLFLSVLPLTIVSAARFNVGSDFMSYYNIYISDSSSWEGQEIGFRLFLTLLRKISDTPQFFFMVTSIFICVSFFRAIYRESVNPIYSLLLFILTNDYFRSMNGIRQYMAISIGLFALPYIKNKDWKKVIIITIIACAFHVTAIIYIVISILSVLNIHPLNFGGIVFIIFIFSNTLRKIVFPFIERFTSYAKYFNTHSIYSNSEFSEVAFLIYLSFFVLLAYEYKKINENRNLKLVYSALMLGMVIMASSVVMPRNITRLGWYVNSIIALYVPEVIRKISSKQLRLGLGCIILVLYSIITITQILGGNQNVLPYQTYWQHLRVLRGYR